MFIDNLKIFLTADSPESTISNVAHTLAQPVDTFDFKNLTYEKLQNYISDNLPVMFTVCINIIFIILLIFISRKIIAVAVKCADKFMTKLSIDKGVRKFLESLFSFLAYFILFIIIADKVGVATTSIIAVLGSAGLAIGLALQGSLSNFAGGILILIMKPFVLGDYIITNNCEGTVQVIGLVYTSILTYDNKKITIPNGSLANGIITNVTAEDERMLELKIGISYNSSIEKAKELFRKICLENGFVQNEFPIITFVDKLDSSAVVIGIRCWCKTSDYLNAKWSLQETIKNECDNNNIDIPYNTTIVKLSK